MHILFLSENFPPESNAPAIRTFEHCKQWVKLGHTVSVITCAPNFPGGKVYEGYQNKFRDISTIEGIKVIRVWSYISANKGFFRRTLDFASYMIAATIASAFVRKVDVVVGTSPQFFTACAAYLVSVIKRVPWVFELRDLWPESIKAVGAMKQSNLLKLLEKIEFFLYCRANMIVAVTHSFKRVLVERGIDPKKIKVVTNGVDNTRFSVREKDQELLDNLGFNQGFVVGYIGTHGMAHGLSIILDAAEIFEHQYPDENLQFMLLGEGSEKQELVQSAQEREIKNVTFVDSVSSEQVANYWSILDVAVIHLRKSPVFKTVIPSKLFECMAMGIPVIHGVHGESAQIVSNNNLGICFEPENVEELVQAILKLKSDDALCEELALYGPIAAKEFDRKHLAKHMACHLQNLTNQ